MKYQFEHTYIEACVDCPFVQLMPEIKRNRCLMERRNLSLGEVKERKPSRCPLIEVNEPELLTPSTETYPSEDDIFQDFLIHPPRNGK